MAASLDSNTMMSRMGATLLTRLLIGAVLGLAVTMGLLWTMQYLIATADRTLEEGAAGHLVDFVRLKRDETTRRKSLKPEKPPLPKAPPPQPPKPQLDEIKPTTEKMDIGAVEVSPDIDLSAGGFSLGTGEGDYLPIVKVAPIYPQRAISRGIEGFVIVEFTVTRLGTVKDVKVVDTEPKSGIFNRAATRAALKFKFKPRVMDGQAVDVPGVRNMITFVLED